MLKRMFSLLLLLICFYPSPAAQAAEETTCAEKKMTIVGHYGNDGKLISPLLEVWSAESGNLKKLELKSKTSAYKIQLDFQNETNKSQHLKEWVLKNNLTPTFDLLSDFKSHLPDTTKIKIHVFDKQKSTIPYCTETFSVMKVDGEGPQ